MFSSNQILDILASRRELPRVLDFAIKLYGEEIFTREDGRVNMAWSVPVPGVYAVGHGTMEPYRTGPNKGWKAEDPSGWKDYPFRYDPDIVAAILDQWSETQSRPVQPETDGSIRKALRVMSPYTAIRSSLFDPEKAPKSWSGFHAILFFVPDWDAYDK